MAFIDFKNNLENFATEVGDDIKTKEAARDAEQAVQDTAISDAQADADAAQTTADSKLDSVATDATLSGDGTAGDPLSVVGGGSSTVNTDTSIDGDGTVGAPLSVNVNTDDTIDGTGKAGAPLAIALSTDVGQTAVLGTDNKLLVPSSGGTQVSGIANNLITLEPDGLAAVLPDMQNLTARGAADNAIPLLLNDFRGHTFTLGANGPAYESGKTFAVIDDESAPEAWLYGPNAANDDWQLFEMPVVSNLSSTDDRSPLAASQGKALSDLINDKGAKDRLFLDDTTLAPAVPGMPTLAEVTTAVGANVGVLAYYTGTDTGTDNPVYVYDVDASGVVTLIEQPVKPTVAEINEYIHNLRDFKVILAHEDAGGHVISINVNGVPATYENLQNAVDNADGSVTFSSGANQNYNRRANTVESIREVGDYLELTTAAIGQFETVWFALSDDTLFAPELTNGEYKVRLFGTGFSLFDKSGTEVANGGSEPGVYRFTRTYFGFKVEKDGVEIYTSPEVLNDYSDATKVVHGVTGLYQVGDRHVQQTTIANTNDTVVDTGHNLSQYPDGFIRMQFVDLLPETTHQWGVFDIPIQDLFDRYDAGELQLQSLTTFDNDFIIIRANSREDLEAGRLLILDNGREAAYMWSELWTKAELLPDRELVFTSAPVVSGSSQNLDSLTWQEIKGQFQSLVINSVVGSGAYQNTIDTSAIVAGQSIVGPYSATLHFAISNIDLTDGQFNISTTSNSADLASLEIWGVRPNALPAPSSGAAAVVFDPIDEFSGGIKIGNGTLSDGRPYTTVEDSIGTVATTSRSFDSSVTPFVEIEVLRDVAATHGPMLRANSTGGRQSQLRFNLSDDVHTVANSGTDTALPTVIKSVVEEKTIKHLVQFNDPIAHTDLEISPAAHDQALTPSVAAVGQTGIVAVRLYTGNPL